MQINSILSTLSTNETTAQEATLAAVFSTTAGGKNYSADVEQSGGEYTATVTGLPGASASGSSAMAAEENLDNRIDMLV
jgi:hypothetical protein